MGPPEKLKVAGLFESLLTYDENQTTTDAEPAEPIITQHEHLTTNQENKPGIEIHEMVGDD